MSQENQESIQCIRGLRMSGSDLDEEKRYVVGRRLGIRRHLPRSHRETISMLFAEIGLERTGRLP